MEQSGIINRLFQSFEDLERAIVSARKTLEAKDEIPKEVVARLDSYDGILSKQKNLANELCRHISVGNWDEVTRLVGLINGLSAMIRDDAWAILSSLELNSDSDVKEEKQHFC
jgi:hypothetical protein